MRRLAIPSSCCLPIGSLRHSPSSGGVQGRGFRREKIRAKIRATAFRARLCRVFGIRARGSARYRILCIGVVKIRDEEAELFFEEPFMIEFVSLPPPVRDSDCAVFGVKLHDRGSKRNALDGDLDLITDSEGAEAVIMTIITAIMITIVVIIIIVVVIVVIAAITVIAIVATTIIIIIIIVVVIVVMAAITAVVIVATTASSSTRHHASHRRRHGCHYRRRHCRHY